MKTACVVRLAFAASLTLSVFPQDLSVKQTQELLKSKGYYSGKVDGVAGPKTKSALEAYQRAQNLPLSGTIDSKTAERLQSGAGKEAAGAASTPVKQSPMPTDSSVKGASGAAKEAAGTAPAAVKQAQTATDSSVKSASGSVKDAAKDAGSSAKSEAGATSSEAKGALGEMKSVFGGKKKTEKK